MRPRWRSVGRRRPTTHRLRPEQRGGRRRNGFLVSRGMAALGVPMRLRHGVGAGRGRKSDAPLRPRRSRLQPPFGQISPLKRPFGALLGQIGKEWLACNAPPDIATSSLASSTHSSAWNRTHLRRRSHRPRCRPATDWSACHGHRRRKSKPQTRPHRRGRCSILGIRPDCSNHP